jgi:hypothetical protein
LTSGSDDNDICLELELLRSVARRALGITALEERTAVVEASQARPHCDMPSTELRS